MWGGLWFAVGSVVDAGGHFLVGFLPGCCGAENTCFSQSCGESEVDAVLELFKFTLFCKHVESFMPRFPICLRSEVDGCSGPEDHVREKFF